MHLGDVTSETIERAQFKDKEFEHFVQLLLLHERELRHLKSAESLGPVARYRSDEKRDLIFVVAGTPVTAREEFIAALTWDDIGQVWYSCKGGGGWKKSFLAELGGAAFKAGKPPTKKTKLRPPEVLLDHLEQGRRFVFVVAEGTIDNKAFLDEITGVLGWWFIQTRKAVPASLRQQLEFIDANKLADFIRTHRPTNLGEAIVKALGVGIPTGFMLWQQWTDELGGRDLPAFEPDSRRMEIFDAIADTSKQAVRVFGPPGAGKTRVVHEGIRRLGSDAQARVRYGTNLDASFGIRHWIRDAGRIYLVLDELRTVDVDVLMETFDANASEGARLFLIGTSDDRTRPESGRAFEIDKLAPEAIDRMIRHEFERKDAAPSDGQLAVVRNLSENYPWYAVLLARALASEPDGVERGDDEAARWSFGARRVLAGSPEEYGGNHAEWDREAVLRAKCLLVAMMTRDLELEWDEIWDRHGDRLAAAIAEPRERDKVKDREKVCRDRQILRESGIRAKRRYVSPNNLARIILLRFFTDPDLGPGVRKHAPEFRGALLAIAKSVQAKPVIDNLARGEWDELVHRAAHEGLGSVASYLSSSKDASYLAALEAPEAAARGTSEVLLRFDESALASASGVRSILRGVLTHVIHRKLSTEAFLAVESALVHLARIEDEPWANNATGVWKSLFLPERHCTHQPWAIRLERLDQRLGSDDPRQRGLAIDALALAVDPREQGLGYVDDDKRDGEWPSPSTQREFVEMKQQLWVRLLDACGDDEITALTAQARRAVTVRIRAGIGRGLYMPELARLTAMVSRWTAEQRQTLSDALADVHRYDADDLAQFTELMDALGGLDSALVPTSLSERLIAQVGTWHPGPWLIDDLTRPSRERAVDRNLARELLATPETLDWALQWLLTPQASRSRGFFQALGSVDSAFALRPRLVDLVHEGGPAQALADYLLGRSDADGPEAIELWIAEQSVDREIAPAFAYFLAMQRPTEDRLERLRELLAHGVPAGSLALLAYREWPQHINLGSMLAFVRQLTLHEDLTQVALLLILELLERDQQAPQHEELLDLLNHALDICSKQRVVIARQHEFEQGILALAAAQRFADVVQLIINSLDTATDQPNVGIGHETLRKMLSKGHGEQLWPHLANAILRDQASILAWQLARDNLLAHVDSDEVVTWIGTDRRRAQVVATLTNPHESTLGEVTRQLLIRFGPDGEVARTLASRAWSTPGAVAGGLSSFQRRQQEHALQWTKDPHPNVRTWAQRLEAEFRHSVEERDARAAFQRKYG